MISEREYNNALNIVKQYEDQIKYDIISFKEWLKKYCKPLKCGRYEFSGVAFLSYYLRENMYKDYVEEQKQKLK